MPDMIVEWMDGIIAWVITTIIDDPEQLAVYLVFNGCIHLVWLIIFALGSSHHHRR